MLLLSAVGVLRWVTLVKVETVHCWASIGKVDMGVKRKGLEMSQK